MNRKRILAIAKLVLLFGTPLALILALFGSGVYCGVENRAAITRFERDWLGLDVQVPDEPADAKPEAKPGTDAKDDTDPDGSPDAEPDAKPDASGDAKAPADATGDAKAPVPEPTPEQPPVTPPIAVVPPGEPSTAGGVPVPVPALETRVDPLGDDLAARLRLPVVVKVKVLVDESVVAVHPDWIDYVQRTVSQASRVYEKQFGITLELSGVSRWTVATEGMRASALLDDLRGRPREGAEVLVGFTNRPFDGTTSGQADTPLEGSAFNGAYGVVYATPGHREAHVRTLLHELAHMFGAKDVVDPAHPAYHGGSWMSYASVPETQDQWIDLENRRRVLDRKDLPFAPEAAPPPAELDRPGGEP